MKLSARNVFEGTITSVEKGAVNAIVKIDIGGGHTVSSTISNAAVEDLGLEAGKKACAIIKSTSVIVGTED